MDGFSGLEPLVGEVVGLRTFRIDESGRLLPVYSDLAWFDGANSAICSPPDHATGWAPRSAHPAPDPHCECGFYAVGSPEMAGTLANARYVLGVVSCWGRVVAGTRGLRAEHARLDALWLHPNTPGWLRLRVAHCYPSTAVYADREAMLAEHPPTQLDCYSAELPAVRGQRTLTAALFGLVLALGLLPSSLLAAPLLHGLWLATAAGISAAGSWVLISGRPPGRGTALLIMVTLLGWLAAPLFGPAGWLLRLPLLRASLRGAGLYLRAVRPGFFPVEPLSSRSVLASRWPAY